ncbi:MAG: very short patch repair endonuclease [Candidatus Omnitrophica bacterium]|nr:very short patch repair endonuclease [Candidatus Omnitrophota bacterium]
MKKRSARVTSHIMSCIPSSKTKMEEGMSKELWKCGIRGYRRNVKTIIGRPDFVWPRRKVIVFCDSSFWHGYEFRKLTTKIKSNTDYWIPKIKRNIQRDKICTKQLNKEGWIVLRFWDFQIKENIGKCVRKIKKVVANSGNICCKSFKFSALERCPVARQAHNLEVIGSNPVPATKLKSTQSKDWVLFNLSQYSLKVEPLDGFLVVEKSQQSFTLI